MDDETVTMSFASLVGIVTTVFERHGMSSANAVLLAEGCVRAECDGSRGHGLFRVADYLRAITSGAVDGRAVPHVEQASPCIFRVDACNGFAPIALDAACEAAMAAAARYGVSIISIRNSHHLGPLWFDIEPFAEQGLVALAFGNSTSRVVPHGGKSPVYGTNPLAFAVPRAPGKPPLVVDQATSTMAFGDVRVAARKHEVLPLGVGVDRHGQETQDAQAIVDGGALLPFGSYKGASIAMMVEVFAAILTGGAFSRNAQDGLVPGSQSGRTGEFILLIDPRLTAAGEISQRSESLIDALKAAGQSHIPGEQRYRRRREAMKAGIRVEKHLVSRFEQYLSDQVKAER